MHKKYAKTISCLLAALLLNGCQATPSSVKNKAKDYTNSKDVTVDKEEFVSVDHLLDNMDSLLKASYQNMILADTIHIEQPQSVSVLQLEIQKNLATPENVKKMSRTILGTNKYDHLIKNFKKQCHFDYDIYGINYNSKKDPEIQIDASGFYVILPNPKLFGAYGIRAIYHADFGQPLGYCTLNGKKVLLDTQCQYVNNWCDKKADVIETMYDDFRVKTIYKCKSDGIEYLAYDICKYYKGIPFDDISYSTDQENTTDTISYFSNILNITTLDQPKIEGMRNNNFCFKIKSEKTHNDKLISLKRALNLAETQMSGAHKSEIIDIDIKYLICETAQTTYTDTGKEKIICSYEARPVWSFIMDNKEHQTKNVQWSRKFINTDMITGKVEYHESDNWDD